MCRKCKNTGFDTSISTAYCDCNLGLRQRIGGLESVYAEHKSAMNRTRETIEYLKREYKEKYGE